MLSSILKHLRNHRKNLSAIVLGQGLAIAGVAVGTRLLTECASTATFAEAKLVVGLALLPMALVLRPFCQFVMRQFHDAQEAGTADGFVHFARQTRMRLSLACALTFVVGLALYRVFVGSPSPVAVLAGGALLVVEAAIALEQALFVTTNRQFSASLMSIATQWIPPFLASAALILVADDPGVLVGAQVLGLSMLALAVKAVRPLGTSTVPAGVEQVAGWTREARHFVTPMLGMGVFGWVMQVGDRYLLAGSVDLDSVGRYVAIYGLIATPMGALNMMMSRFLTPLLFRSAARADRGRQRSVRLYMTAVGCLAALAAFAFIWLFGERLAALLLAAEYRQGAKELMNWLVAGYGFLVIAAAYEADAMARKTTFLLSVVPGVAAAVNVGTNLILIPRYGITGAAVATFAANAAYLATFILLSELSGRRTLAGLGRGDDLRRDSTPEP